MCGMDHDHVIHSLQRKRAEIAGRLEVAHARILASLDATIHMFAPYADLDEISPKKHTPMIAIPLANFMGPVAVSVG